MPATTQTASALVAGALGRTEPVVRVRLLRPICIKGLAVQPGEIDVDRALAAMLIGSRKAEKLDPAPPKSAAPAPQPKPTGRQARPQE